MSVNNLILIIILLDEVLMNQLRPGPEGGRAVPPPRAPKTLGPPKSQYIYILYMQLGQVRAANKSPERQR